MQQLNDFIRGEEDCKKGVPHKPDQTREYDAGYDEQRNKFQAPKDGQNNYTGKSK